MGLLDKLRKKKENSQAEVRPDGQEVSAEREDQDGFQGLLTPRAEISPGGSVLYRYAKPEAEETLLPGRGGRYRKTVCAHFEALFPGRESFVFRAAASDPVPADIHVLAPAPGGEYYVFYTTGMSEQPMPLPGEAADWEGLARAEVYLFLPASWDLGMESHAGEEIPAEAFWPVQLLRFVAGYPQEFHSWLGRGQTISNGPEYSPLCPETQMCGAVLSQLAGDIMGVRAADGVWINFLFLIPAYREELECARKYGMEELDRRFEAGRLPMVLDLGRPNFCAAPAGAAER